MGGWMNKYNFFNSSTDGFHEIDLHGSTRQAGRPRVCVCVETSFFETFSVQILQSENADQKWKNALRKRNFCVRVSSFYNNRLSDRFPDLCRGLSGFHRLSMRRDRPRAGKNAFWSDRKTAKDVVTVFTLFFTAQRRVCIRHVVQ